MPELDNNIFGSSYHLRETECQAAQQTFPTLVDSMRSWRQRKLWASVSGLFCFVMLGHQHCSNSTARPTHTASKHMHNQHLARRHGDCVSSGELQYTVRRASGHKNKVVSVAGNRTRVLWVKATCPNRLDYYGTGCENFIFNLTI